MNLARTFTLPKAPALTNRKCPEGRRLPSSDSAGLPLILVGLLLNASVQAARPKSYENFGLPASQMQIIPEAPVSYLGSRVQLKKGTSSRFNSPGVNGQEYMYAKEAFLAEKRDEAIKLLRQELDSGLTKNKDNILLRLGQLYAEKYTELNLHENELYTQQLQEFEKKKAVDKTAVQPKIDNSRSMKYLKDALTLFTTLEKDYPSHPRIDEITFFIGYVEMEYGNNAKGVKYLERVVSNYPRSRKYEEAVIFLGDYYFEKSRFREALAKYHILITRRDSALYHYASYKIAWCNLNLGSPIKALRDMKALIASLQGSRDTAKFNLREQALRDLVVFYGDAGSVDEAIQYFTEMLGKERALENLRLLADIYRSKAKDDDAIKAYSRLIEEFGDLPDAPKLYLGLYDSLARLGKTSEAVGSLAKAVVRFGTSSDWAKKFPSDKAADVKNSQDTLMSESQKIAYFYHNSAQKSSNKVTYQFAMTLYRALLQGFPQSKENKSLAFYLAEIYYAQGKWREAADSYMVAAQIPPRDKLADESIYNALLALDRLTAKDDKIERYSKDEQKNVNLTPQEIPANEKRFLEVSEFYLKEYPKGERVVDVKFRLASIYYKYHHFDKAQELFKEIALTHPKHRAAMTAAGIVLDIYNLKKDYTNLELTTALFLKTDGLGDEEFRADLAQVNGEISFKKIESFERSDKWKEAGDTYYSYYKANPTGKLAEKALYNAFISYEKSNDGAKAAEVSRLFISKYPKSEYTERFTLNLAKLAEKQYDFDQAQHLYEDYHKKYPNGKESRTALYNAAVFAELLDRNTAAIALYEQYLKTGQVSAEERKSIVISEAKMYRKEQNWTKVTQIYRRLIRDARSENEKLELLGELARQYEKGGKMQERADILNEIRVLFGNTKGGKDSGPAMQFVAEGKFKNVAKQREKYEKIELKLPPEDLVYLMKRKQRALTKLAASYDEVVEVGVPDWGVAALLEKSDAFENYAKSFRAVKIPGKYRGADREELEKQLKAIEAQVVKPLEDKVAEIVKSCTQKAAQFSVVNEYAAKCRQKAQALQGDKPGTDIEPSGVLPQPSYWTTRFVSGGVAKP
jgi:cellulose synthase operon protein C